MGAVYRFDLNSLKSKNNLVNYVETGTGEGTCLAHAKKFSFTRNISIEIHKEIYDNAKLKFPQDELLLGSSYDKLKEVLPTLEGNTLFFLDAHFPGADFHYTEYSNCGEDEVRLPLQKELELLLEYRKKFNDVIIIDDLRIYMNGPFEGGNWELRESAGSKKCGFIFDILNELNKSVAIDYRDQGYVVAV